MKLRNAIKTDLFAAETHRRKIDSLGDPLVEIESCIDFAALAAEVDRIAPRPASPQGGRPPYPTETMVRILVLKRLYNLSDEQMEYQLLDRMSYQRFCGLSQAANIPDRTTVWTFENRIGESGAQALFDGMNGQLLAKGFIARGGQIIDATLVPAPKQHMSKEEKALVGQGATPADWTPAQRRQKDTEATWTKKHGKSYFGFKLSVNVNKKYKVIRKIETGTASTHDTEHFDAVLDGGNTSQDVFADGVTPRKRERRSSRQRVCAIISSAKASGTSRCRPASSDVTSGLPRRVRVLSIRFAAIAQMGGKLVRTIGQARANFAMTMMATCYNLKRMAYFVRKGIKAF